MKFYQIFIIKIVQLNNIVYEIYIKHLFINKKMNFYSLILLHLKNKNIIKLKIKIK